MATTKQTVTLVAWTDNVTGSWCVGFTDRDDADAFVAAMTNAWGSEAEFVTPMFHDDHPEVDVYAGPVALDDDGFIIEPEGAE